MQQPFKPILVFTWGNPSRGDDALGPKVHDLLQQQHFADVDLLTDFQLQIEHAMDLENRQCILFVDASITADTPYEFTQLLPAVDDSYTTHAMSPQSLLSVYEKIYKQQPPPAYLLSIRGYEFALGLPLSDRARDNFDEAIGFIGRLLTEQCDSWPDLTNC